MKDDMFTIIFLSNLNNCESLGYIKMIFEELEFITVVYGNLFTLVHPACSMLCHVQSSARQRLRSVVKSRNGWQGKKFASRHAWPQFHPIL